jgi:hypothetical protein
MSVISGIFAANAASDSQEATNKSNNDISNASLAQQKELYNDTIAREKPFYDAGVTANSQLGKMVNGGYNMQESPAAQYELQQGTKSLNRQLSARGLLGSGNASQRLAELSSGVAANDYNQQYSRLLDQVKIGTGASASAGAASNTLGNQIGQNSQQTQQNNTNSGNARASLYSGMGGLSSSAVNTGINAYRSGLFGSAAAEGTTYDAGGASFAGNAAGSGVVDNYGAELAL